LSKATVDVYDLEGKSVGKIELPEIFVAAFRPDLIRRAVVATQSRRFQPKGRNPMAGKRTSAESYGVGRDLARVPRMKGDRHPTSGMAAFAPGTVGGRLAHPPTPEKVVEKRINKKERRLAFYSAVAATGNKEAMVRRGHIVDGVPNLPLVVSNELQSLTKTAEAKNVFIKLGLWGDVERVIGRTKIRAGRGRMRGRRKKLGVGPLLVVAEDKGVGRAVGNMPGVDVVDVDDLNVELLAPGTHAGRLTAWTESAMKALAQRRSGGN